jgi:rhodanese-related sulfurtransferase
MPTEIDIAKVQQLLDRGDAQLVEVLPPREHDEEHLPGATNIPLKTLDHATAATLNRQKPVIVYCWDDA